VPELNQPRTTGSKVSDDFEISKEFLAASAGAGLGAQNEPAETEVSRTSVE